MSTNLTLTSITGKPVTARVVVSGRCVAQGQPSQLRPASALAQDNALYGHGFGFNGRMSTWTNAHTDARGLINS